MQALSCHIPLVLHDVSLLKDIKDGIVMSAQNATKEYGEMSLADRLCAAAEAGQAAILEAQLKRGIPLVFQDDKGNLVQKNPDGTITSYKIP